MKTMQHRGFSLIGTQWLNFQLKEAKVRSLACSISHHQRPNKGCHRHMLSSSNLLFRQIETARPVTDSGHSLHNIARIAERELSALEDEVNEILQIPNRSSKDAKHVPDQLPKPRNLTTRLYKLMSLRLRRCFHSKNARKISVPYSLWILVLSHPPRTRLLRRSPR